MSEGTGKRWGWATLGVFLFAVIAIAPSVGNFGYTYDEPAYRYSQMLSQQWWERLARGEFKAILEPDALLYYWPYGRHGINFHPPLAGQLNLLTYKLFGGILKDVPARRMASALEFAVTVTMLFGFMAKRYGGWTGLVAGGSLLFMPRVFGQAHLIDTDMPGLMLWAATGLAFWKGITQEKAGLWRVAVGVLVGLAFVEKMGAVLVVLPILGWIAVTSFAPAIKSLVRMKPDRGAWVDGILSSSLMIVPLGLAYLEIRRLAVAFLTIQSAMGMSGRQISPASTDLFRDHPQTWMPGGILLVPLIVWIVRGLVRRLVVKGEVTRPALEVWLALLAFGPAIAWLGNPSWWRETLPRLAHYYSISTARRGVLPDIQIIYFGQIYEYSLPWHNAWVLIAITVPAMILIASVIGLYFAPWRDRLPIFFLINLVTLPVMRMLPTPAHDGVRLFLPAFFFLAAFAGWGAMGLAEKLSKPWWRPVIASIVLLPSAWGLITIHPYELSYYNAFIGGPSGAWHAGFELSYWYDAFTDKTIAEISANLPLNANVAFANVKSAPDMVPSDQQALGVLREDIQFGPSERLGYIWLLTHDSKADCFSRLLSAMVPWYAVEPLQLDKARVAMVAEPESVARAWALQLMLDEASKLPPAKPQAPEWVRTYAPFLGRLWGDGVTKIPPLAINTAVLDWGRDDAKSLREAARWIAEKRTAEGSASALRLMTILQRYPDRLATLIRSRPEALEEAVEIVIQEPAKLRKVLLRQGYTDMRTVGGCLDRDM